MLYAKLADGGEPIFPYGETQLRADAAAIRISLPADLTGVDLSELRGVAHDAPPVPEPAEGEEPAEPDWQYLRVVRIEEVAPPEEDGLLYEPVIAQLGDDWLMGWEQVDEDPAAIAARLAELELRLLQLIDRQAGAFRTRFITDVPGQAETYLQKRQEAEAYGSDPGGDYPMLEAEAAARAITIAALAAEVTATAGAWLQLGAQIEGLRMGAKSAVRAATSWAGKKAAAQVDWESLLP